MPKVLDIIEVKRVIEDKLKQLYPDSRYVVIRSAHQYPSLGKWSASINISINDKVRTFYINIEIETGNLIDLTELI